MSTIKGHGAKFSSRKDEAIAALLSQPTVAEAARVANIRPQTLGRWMKDPAFEAVWREARSGGLDQAIARLQKISGAAVSALLKVMFDIGAPPAARLKAAETVLRHAKAANEIDHLQARLSDLEHARDAADAKIPGPSADEPRRSPGAGHGAKFIRRKEDAIAALLTQRSVEEAARVIDIGSQTLYRWMKYPEFQAAWREAKRAAFGQANARLHQASGSAVTTIVRVMADSATPASARVRAADLALTHGITAMGEDIEARLSVLGYAADVAEAALRGDKRTFDEIAKDRPKAAA
jgi:transposase-like protein